MIDSTTSAGVTRPNSRIGEKRLMIPLFLVAILINILFVWALSDAHGGMAWQNDIADLLSRAYLVLLFAAALVVSLASSRRETLAGGALASVLMLTGYLLQWQASLPVLLVVFIGLVGLSVFLSPKADDLGDRLAAGFFVLAIQSSLLYYIGHWLNLNYIEQIIHFPLIGLVFDFRVLFASAYMLFGLISAVQQSLRRDWPEPDEFWRTPLPAPEETSGPLAPLVMPLRVAAFVVVSAARDVVNWTWVFVTRIILGIIYVGRFFVANVLALLRDPATWWATLNPLVTLVLIVVLFAFFDNAIPHLVNWIVSDLSLMEPKSIPWWSLLVLGALLFYSAGVIAATAFLWLSLPARIGLARAATFSVVALMSFAIAGFILWFFVSGLPSVDLQGFRRIGPLTLALFVILALPILETLLRNFNLWPVQAELRDHNAALRSPVSQSVPEKIEPAPKSSLARRSVRWLALAGALLVVGTAWFSTSAPRRSEVPMPTIALRGEPRSLSEEELIRSLQARDLFDARRNPSGTQRSQFLANDDGTVIDLSTGLVWQRAASSTPLDKSDANAFIDSLNTDPGVRFPWRLPTTEEAATLFAATVDPTPDKLPIHKAFYDAGRNIWTADSTQGGHGWIADVSEGKMAWTALGFRHWVRAVRQETR